MLKNIYDKNDKKLAEIFNFLEELLELDLEREDDYYDNVVVVSVLESFVGIVEIREYSEQFMGPRTLEAFNALKPYFNLSELRKEAGLVSSYDFEKYIIDENFVSYGIKKSTTDNLTAIFIYLIIGILAMIFYFKNINSLLKIFYISTNGFRSDRKLHGIDLVYRWGNSNNREAVIFYL